MVIIENFKCCLIRSFLCKNVIGGNVLLWIGDRVELIVDVRLFDGINMHVDILLDDVRCSEETGA